MNTIPWAVRMAKGAIEQTEALQAMYAAIEDLSFEAGAGAEARLQELERLDENIREMVGEASHALYDRAKNAATRANRLRQLTELLVAERGADEAKHLLAKYGL